MSFCTVVLVTTMRGPMADLKSHETRIQVLVTVETKQGRFQDSLYFSPEEFEKADDESIRQQGQDRADAWVAFVEEQSNKPPPDPEVVRKSLAEEMDNLLKRELELEGVEATEQAKTAALQVIETKRGEVMAERAAAEAAASEGDPKDPPKEEPKSEEGAVAEAAAVR